MKGPFDLLDRCLTEFKPDPDQPLIINNLQFNFA